MRTGPQTTPGSLVVERYAYTNRRGRDSGVQWLVHRVNEDGEEVVIWNTAEKLWLPVPVFHWIIRGVHGEFYPCAPAIFELTYEAVDA